MTEKHRVPTIDEFVPGFTYETRESSRVGMIYKGKAVMGEEIVTWVEQTILYPSLQFRTTFYYKDGNILTFTPNPLWDEPGKEYYLGLIESKSVRTKI